MVSRIPYRVLTSFIIGVAVLSVASLSVSIFAFSRQASIAQNKASEAIAATQRSSADTGNAVCVFLLTFVSKPGEPGFTSPRGKTTEVAARRAYVALGCTAFAGPLPAPSGN